MTLHSTEPRSSDRIQHPSDLAELVYAYLLADLSSMNRDLGALPDLGDLTRLFETLFYLSLQTEEGQPIACSVAFMPRRATPRMWPKGKPHVEVSTWNCIGFPRSLQCNIRTLRKLALAVDPRAAALGVYPKRHELRIWGIVDQFPLHLERFTSWESIRQATTPGLFYVRLTGPGELTVYVADRIFAVLRQNRLISHELDAMFRGPLSGCFHAYVKTFLSNVRRSVGSELYNSAGKWFEGTDELYRCSEDFGAEMRDQWLGTLCRVLLKIR